MNMNLWQEDFKTAIKSTAELENFLDNPIPQTSYSLFIPKKFLTKIKKAGPHSPLWKQFIPSANEESKLGMIDPIGDQNFLVTKNLIHRYQNRALFIPTTNCPIACRYCFRKNELSDQNVFKSELQESLTYLKNHPEINEIIFTGGDPFILSDEKLLDYAIEFSKISTIHFLRFHTRTPVILPNRINDSFIANLLEIKKYFKQVTIMIHTNHADELDEEVTEALIKLKDAHIMLFSQTVLLKDVNDHENVLTELFLKLGTLGIVPYYLHHPDRARGTTHFQLPLEIGRQIYSKLRNNLSGWLIPQYIIDIPKGEGKVSAFNPEEFKFSGKLINKSGKIINIEDNFED
jgi:lysine 2,3-aminomutase